MDNYMKILIGLLPFIVIVIINFLFDLLLANSFRWCRKKNCGKACRIWNCKNYDTCSKFIDCAHGLRVLSSSHFYVLDNDMRIPVPDYISEINFPITFTNGCCDFTFHDLDDMAEWARTVYYELYRRPENIKRNRTRLDYHFYQRTK